MEEYILSIDQGTTSSRAIIFDSAANIITIDQQEFKQIYPKPGLVEHDPSDILKSQLIAIENAIVKSDLPEEKIKAIGITNQRETTIIWDRKSGDPIYNAIVWQDRRTSDFCTELIKNGYQEIIKSKTGLIIDAYFSASKIKWILDNVSGARDKAENAELAFGTVDSWLIWNLTNKEKHLTDVTNASRTMLFNIHSLEWDYELLNLFDIPLSLMPAVKSSSEIYGYTKIHPLKSSIPIAGIAGDQQAALFGQLCTEAGMLKNTYGTGAFLILNTGNEPIVSKNNLLTTIAYQINSKVIYALEGSIFIAGAIVQWLRDEMQIINTANEIEDLANSVKDNGGVYFIPALAGLGAPHWDQYARGAIFGLTRGSNKGHIARSALESIAYQTYDIIKSMETDSNIQVNELRVDGGATSNDTLMQFQSDILGISILKPNITETTALGVAYLAGLAVGIWKDIDEIKNNWKIEKKFIPQIAKSKKNELLNNWHKAVERSKNWLK